MLSKDSWKYPSQSSHPVDSSKPGGRQTAAWLRGVPQLCLWANCFIFESQRAYLYNREDNEVQTLQNGGPLHVTLVLSSPHAHGMESRSLLSPPNVGSSWKALVVAHTSCWGALPTRHCHCPTADLAGSSSSLSFGISLVAFTQLVTEGSRASGGSHACCPQGLMRLIDRGHLLGPRCARRFILKISLNQ